MLHANLVLPCSYMCDSQRSTIAVGEYLDTVKCGCCLGFCVCCCWMCLSVWFCSVFTVNVCSCMWCVCDGSAAVGANGFTEKNTAGHDVSRGVKATVG